ncbi:MAG: hypothetical protein M1822_008853 [Bathelium mastoideum]|nr:MAG: hypothetical protein M1822_008853 [Bathelium mastoideum]
METGSEPNLVDKEGLCLLSLDGGGVRGLSSLYILQGLMQRLNHERQKDGLLAVKPCDVFDLIGGTSTGGLIAIMLGRLKMTVDACIHAYKELMKSVFEAKLSRIPVDWMGETKARFDSGKLKKAIEKVIIDSGASKDDFLDDGQGRGCRVFVCATAHETTSATRLRSYSLPSKRDISATICEAALATSAATGFFDPVCIGERKFEDGGLLANNPAEEVEEEAANIWCSDSREVMPLVKCFVSVGTGNPGKKAIEDNMLKFLSKTLVDLATETERTEKRMIARWARLFTEKRYFRLNVEQGLQDIGLAEYKEQGRIEAATEEYLDHMQQNTCEHTVRMIQLQTKSRVFCNIPFPRNTRFIGRDELLESLYEKISNNHEGQKLAITGLGGIGKTQIALELAYRVRTKASDCSIFWIPAINKEGLEQTFIDIMQELQLAGWEEKGADSKVLLQQHLSQKSAGRWLLIFDNADDITMWLETDKRTKALVDQLPRSNDGCILFTTRDRKTAVKLAHQEVYTVADADKEMAMQLLHGYLAKKQLMDDTQKAVELLNDLAFLPLAIVQAAAYINENDSALAEYLELLAEQEEDKVELLSQDFEDEGRYREITNPVAATWLISFERIRTSDSLAANYLSFMACVEPTDIPQSMLPAAQSRLQEKSAIGLLKAYSFVVEKTAKGTLDMHRLVHLATRNWLRKENELAEWVTKVRQQLSEAFPNNNHMNRSVWRLYLSHARCVLGYEAYDSKETVARTKLLWKFAGCLSEDGKYNEAEIAYKEVIKARKEVLGEEHPDTLTSIANLASTYRNQGRWKEAEELEVRVMETSVKVLGEEHPDTLTSMANLASTYWNQGRWKEAEELEVQVMETSVRVLGEEHPSTLTSMNNLASTYWNQGRWKEAEELGVRVMEMRVRVLGEEHPDTLTSMANLALTYMNQGRWKEAEELGVRVMETSVRVLGEEHPDTLTSMANLAVTYRNQGRWKEAEELEVRVMETSVRVLGEEHPDTLTSMANLASTYRNQGRWKEAEELEVRVMETRVRVLGEEHPSTLTSMANLASTYRNQGRWKEAEELDERVMETSVRVLGEEHPSTLTSMANLAVTYSEQGRQDKAEPLKKQVMETRVRVLGEEHPSTLTSMANLAVTYSEQGRQDKAEPLKKQVMETRVRVLGEEHPSTLTSMANLASTYWNQGRWKEAEELEVRVMETRVRVLGEEHPDTLTSMNNLAFTWKEQGHDKDAIKLMSDCFRLRTEALGAVHPDTQSSSKILNNWKVEQLDITINL